MSPAHGTDLAARLASMPVIAILRGLQPAHAIPVVEALWQAGIRIAEVPLNSPEPFDTVRRLAAHFGARMAIGAGTVLTVEEVDRLAEIGCGFCVSPNTDARVIEAAIRAGMTPIPGFATATEAFVAIAAGARMLKAFPAAGAAGKLAAMKVVLPKDVLLVAVGGVTPAEFPALRTAGADAFGIGSDLYRPGWSAAEVGARAQRLVAALRRGAAVAPRLLCNPQATIGESPIALGDGRGLLWVDPIAPRLLRFVESENTCHEMPLSAPVWSIEALPDGALAGTGDAAFCTLDADRGALRFGPTVEVGAGCRLNDMTIDARGGLWAGSMHRGLLGGHGALFHAPSADAPARRVACGLGVANGMAFSADARTLYVIDTLARTLLAYPADIGAGALGEPVIVTDFLGVPGKPDGMAVAPDGALWVAMWGGGAVVRIAADGGALLESIAIPAPQVSSVCFDAAGRAFVTTSRARLSAEALAAFPSSGGVFAIDLGANAELEAA